VVVRLCKVGLVGVPLKDAATLVGRRLKESPVGDEIYSLRVRNAAADADPHGKVRVDRFPDASFDPAGDPGAVRDAWKYPTNCIEPTRRHHHRMHRHTAARTPVDRATMSTPASTRR